MKKTRRHELPLLAGLALAPLVSACAGSEPDGAVVSVSDNNLVADILSVDRNEDGTFRVRCLDRTTSTPYVEDRVSGEALQRNDVCRRVPAAPVHGGFTCGGYLWAHFAFPSGGEKDIRVTGIDREACEELSLALAWSRAAVSGNAVFAACTGGTTLRRFLISPVDVVELSGVATGDREVCREAALSITGMPPLAGATQGTFFCSGEGEVLAQFVTPSGIEQLLRVHTEGGPSCRETAANLAATRATIATAKRFGVCTANASLRQFSITGAGELRELAPRLNGSMAACRAAERELNR